MYLCKTERENLCLWFTSVIQTEVSNWPLGFFMRVHDETTACKSFNKCQNDTSHTGNTVFNNVMHFTYFQWNTFFTFNLPHAHITHTLYNSVTDWVSTGNVLSSIGKLGTTRIRPKTHYIKELGNSWFLFGIWNINDFLFFSAEKTEKNKLLYLVVKYFYFTNICL